MLTQNSSTVLSFFAPRKWLLWIVLVIIFGIGLAIRFYDLTDPPLDFHSTRQLHSAVMARGMYYQTRTDIPDWQREIAIRQWKAEGVIEPPFMEWLTAQTYRLIGNDSLWVARVYSILFWMAGGVGMFLLARELAGGMDGAVIALVYFLILPYGAQASRSFQPDPLMTSLIIFSYWGLVNWYKRPTWTWTVIAGLLCGLAILSKSVAVFFSGAAMVGLVLFSRSIQASGEGKWFNGLRDLLRQVLGDLKIWVLGILTVLPYGIYHVYGMYIADFLQSQFSLRFFPQLWIDPVFYLRWNGMLSSVVGFEWFLVALLCTFLVRNRAHRAMLLASWLGYFAYGLTLSYTISTHDYYQLPLIPLVALGLGTGAELVLRMIKGPKWLLYAVVIGITLFAVTIKAWDVRVTLRRMDYHAEVAFWQKLGKKLGPGASVVGLTQDYGMRLAYWGWITPTNWLTAGDFNVRELAGQKFDIRQVFKEQTAGKDFFLVTMFSELDNQGELKKLLYDNYPILEQTDDYIIFDLRHPKS